MSRSIPQPERGDVWIAGMPGDKRRPVVVLTRSSVLPRLSTVLVAPVTIRVRGIPTELPLGSATACLVVGGALTCPLDPPPTDPPPSGYDPVTGHLRARRTISAAAPRAAGRALLVVGRERR